MNKFGNLKKLQLRSVWPNEARSFPRWLAANMQPLSEALGMELEVVQQEANVGNFSLDLLVKDLSTNRNVIIENQLETTDHNHLGKLLTQAARFEASTIVWIAANIRAEHRQSLEWLNQHTRAGTQFFGVVIEVWQIDDSKPAFNFKLVVSPREQQKTTQQQQRQQPSKMPPSKAEAYQHYFQLLSDELREKHNFTGARKGQSQNWYTFASGVTDITYGVSFAMGKRVRVELKIDSPNVEKNKALFDKLAQNRDETEARFHERIEWERLDEQRASRIAIYRPGSIEDDAQKLKEIRIWTIDHLLKLKKVFSVYLEKLW